MRSVSLIAAVVFLFSSAFASEIREFSIRTLERLGNELSHRDEIAARAEDLVMEQHPEAKSLTMRGWITDLHPNSDVVYLIMEKDSSFALAYSVTFPPHGHPIVEDHGGEALPQRIATRFKARRNAIDAVKGQLFDASYNFEVLDDPSGSGFLVYALASTNKTGEEITGGHFRITVSSDGSKVKRVDALSRGIIKENPKLPKGAEPVAIATSQLVSNVPVETCLYSSHLYKLPIYVATKDGSSWRVANGKIHKFTKAEIAAMEKEKKK